MFIHIESVVKQQPLQIKHDLFSYCTWELTCSLLTYFTTFFLPVGRGGASIFGKQFEDELNPELKFTGKNNGKVPIEYKVSDVEETNVGL